MCQAGLARLLPLPMPVYALLGDPDGTNAGQCSAYAAEQINIILARATERQESTPPLEAVMDQLVAPIMYRILFRPDGLGEAHLRTLIDRAATAGGQEG